MASQEIGVEGYEGQMDQLGDRVVGAGEERQGMKEKTARLAKQMLGDGASEGSSSSSSGGVAGCDDLMAALMYVSNRPAFPPSPCPLSRPPSPFGRCPCVTPR